MYVAALAPKRVEFAASGLVRSGPQPRFGNFAECLSVCSLQAQRQILRAFINDATEVSWPGLCFVHHCRHIMECFSSAKPLCYALHVLSHVRVRSLWGWIKRFLAGVGEDCHRTQDKKALEGGIGLSLSPFLCVCARMRAHVTLSLWTTGRDSFRDFLHL